MAKEKDSLGGQSSDDTDNDGNSSTTIHMKIYINITTHNHIGHISWCKIIKHFYSLFWLVCFEAELIFYQSDVWGLNSCTVKKMLIIMGPNLNLLLNFFTITSLKIYCSSVNLVTSVKRNNTFFFRILLLVWFWNFLLSVCYIL